MEIPLLVAFLGGVISLLTPCSVMVIPLFATALTQRKSHPFQVVAAFSAGLMISLLPLAIGASILNQLFHQHRQIVSVVIGILLLVIGVGYVLGKHLPLPDISARFQQQKHMSQVGAMVVLGMFAGLGSTACVGPILGAIISLGAVASHALASIAIMIAYALGLIVPLTLLTWVYANRKQSQVAFIRKLHVPVLGNSVPLSQFLTGLLLIFVAYLFIFHQGSPANIPLINNSHFLDQVFDLEDSLLQYRQ